MTWQRFIFGRCFSVLQRNSFFSAAILVMVCPLLLETVLADGCFVYKWNKAIDINEPNQKAIIVYDAGREDLLLQVKYEGPLEQFGWLIPVPSLPTVQKGSMEAFYELSQLTQRQAWENRNVVTLQMQGTDGAQSVKVIQIKTVGAYEVAILSAQDAGGLGTWLKTHDYSMPGENAEIVNDYIRKGWYFIAVKVQLNQGESFKLVSGPKDWRVPQRSRANVKKKLASGELHPLLISFDSPECIFPLRISAISGKPSEVSLYVLSQHPLLNKGLLDENRAALDKSYNKWATNVIDYAKVQRVSFENAQTLHLAFQLAAAERLSAHSPRAGREHQWSVDELRALVREDEWPIPQAEPINREFWESASELIPWMMHVAPNQIAKTSRSLPRLKDKSWFLMRIDRIFSPSQMRNLEFQSAVPMLSPLLDQASGQAAAEALAQCGRDGVSALIAACNSENSTERVNAAIGLLFVRGQRAIDPLLRLLKDKTPQVRLHAVQAVGNNLDLRFIQPLLALFHDPYQKIRSAAAAALSVEDKPERTPVYLSLQKNGDPDVRICALDVLLRLNRHAIPAERLIEMLKDSNPDVQSSAVEAIWQLNSNRDLDRPAVNVPRSALLPVLSSERMANVALALKLIEGTGQIHYTLRQPLATKREEELRERQLSSAEATTLTTSRLDEARLLGLVILERNADKKAVELILPLLRDPNVIVRNRAFSVLEYITGENISETDPAKWEHRWETHKSSYVETNPQQ